jgi:hypothetical protein
VLLEERDLHNCAAELANGSDEGVDLWTVSEQQMVCNLTHKMRCKNLNFNSNPSLWKFRRAYNSPWYARRLQWADGLEEAGDSEPEAATPFRSSANNNKSSR